MTATVDLRSDPAEGSAGPDLLYITSCGLTKSLVSLIVLSDSVQWPTPLILHSKPQDSTKLTGLHFTTIQPTIMLLLPFDPTDSTTSLTLLDSGQVTMPSTSIIFRETLSPTTMALHSDLTQSKIQQFPLAYLT